jgi:hypothetical protein
MSRMPNKDFSGLVIPICFIVGAITVQNYLLDLMSKEPNVFTAIFFLAFPMLSSAILLIINAYSQKAIRIRWAGFRLGIAVLLISIALFVFLCVSGTLLDSFYLFFWVSAAAVYLPLITATCIGYVNLHIPNDKLLQP